MRYQSITQAAFARLINVSPTSVRRFIAAKQIAIDKSVRPAKVFLDAPLTKRFLEKRKPPDEGQEKKDIERLLDLSQNMTVQKLELVPLSTFRKAKTIAEVIKARTQTLALDGRLMPRRVVENYHKQLVSVDYSSICPLGTNLCYEIDTIMKEYCDDKTTGLKKIEQLVNKEIKSALDRRRDEINKFLESLKRQSDKKKIGKK